jgi:3-mercaptopyruvate sulfurtransferase SseA
LPDVRELCKHLIELGLRHNDHAVLIGDHHIAAAHRMPG